MSGMSRMDPVKITLGVLVLILAGVAGYLGYKYNSQCAGTNGVSCFGAGVHLEGNVCTADVKSCGEGKADENGVCKFSASSGSGGSFEGFGASNIAMIVIAGVLLLVGGSIMAARALERNKKAIQKRYQQDDLQLITNNSAVDPSWLGRSRFSLARNTQRAQNSFHALSQKFRRPAAGRTDPTEPTA